MPQEGEEQMTLSSGLRMPGYICVFAPADTYASTPMQLYISVGTHINPICTQRDFFKRQLFINLHLVALSTVNQPCRDEITLLFLVTVAMASHSFCFEGKRR